MDRNQQYLQEVFTHQKSQKIKNLDELKLDIEKNPHYDSERLAECSTLHITHLTEMIENILIEGVETIHVPDFKKLKQQTFANKVPIKPDKKPYPGLPTKNQYKYTILKKPNNKR
jgi:hypothetical protein